MTTLPAGPSAPVALQSLAWLRRPTAFLDRCRARYGDVFTIQVARAEGPWVVLAHPDAVKEVFTGRPEDLRAGEGNEILGPVLGPRSVLLLDGREHLAQRRLLLPPFHGERMQRYGQLMAEVARAEIAGWPRGAPFRLAPRMQAVTLEVILRAVFGTRPGPRHEELRERLRRMLGLLVDPKAFALVGLIGARVNDLPFVGRPVQAVDELIYAEIRERRREADLEQRDDILSLLLQATHEDGTPMSDEELRDELVTLLVAGHETTATALSWALERLLRHADAWERLREEARAGEDAYAEAVIHETLRLRPVLPVVLRRLTRPMTIAGHDLPAGVKVAPCIYLVHRREDVYPDPAAFRPERFLERPPGTYTWIPFGGGVRRCLGAAFAQFEMKVVLRELALGVDLRAAEREAERIGRRAITLAPARGAEVLAA
jgi:cytochrome P450